MTALTLASQSTARVQILRNAGVSFETDVSGVDEDHIKSELLARGALPVDIAMTLAERKAVAVSGSTTGLVIGADQVLELSGAHFDKVSDLTQARERLITLRGRAHILHAGTAVARDGVIVWREMRSAFLTMRDFSDRFLDGYLGRNGDRILSSIGCYHMEGEGVQLFEEIQGDYFTILGLPLLGLLRFLRDAGVLTP